MASLGDDKQAERQDLEADRSSPTRDQGRLAKAFRGELVPQDPNAEPASVLLERIREERAGQSKASRKNDKIRIKLK